MQVPTSRQCNTDHKCFTGSTQAQKSWASLRNPRQQGSPGVWGERALRNPAVQHFLPSGGLLTSHRRAEEERLAQSLQHRSHRLWGPEHGVTDLLPREGEGVSDTGSNTSLVFHIEKLKTRREISGMLRFQCCRRATCSALHRQHSLRSGQLSRAWKCHKNNTA